jgi:hypothetical protein
MTCLKNIRKSAFTQQNGKCCYCGFHMWLDSADSFAKHHGISVKQARHFQCTAEHLKARQEGGLLKPTLRQPVVVTHPGQWVKFFFGYRSGSPLLNWRGLIQL